MNKPSVAIIGTRGYPSYYGGFETAIRHIAPYLSDQGWDVTVYGRKKHIKSNTTPGESPVHSVETKGIDFRSLSTLSYGWTASRHVKKVRPDVVLVMNVANGFYLPGLRKLGIPTVVNVDGLEWLRDKWSRIGKVIFFAGAKFTAKYATRIVVDSKEIGKYWKSNFNRDGSFIPYGGNLLSTRLELEPGLKSNNYVLYVARLVPENSAHEFFEAAKEIAKSHDVVIVGSTGYGGELDEAAKKLDENHPRIRWLGHVSDDQRLHSLWQNAGVYFHGHSVGGTNPALVQAMACGAPVVALDTEFNREVLGKSGLYTSKSSLSIMRAVMKLLNDKPLQAKLSSQGALRVSEHYSWDDICGKYHSILREAMEFNLV